MRALSLSLLVVVAACTVTDSPFLGVDAGPAPPAIFQVAGTEPAADALDVSRTSTIVITFNAMVDASSLSASSLVVVDHAGAPVAGTTHANDRAITFTPEAGLERVRTYQVTLGADVADTSGLRLDAGRTWTFRTADGGWSAPVALASGDPAEASLPRLAFAVGGYAFAAWYERSGAPDERRVVRSSVFSPTTGWGQPLVITPDGLGSVTDIAMAIAPSGDGFILWNEGLTTGERRIAASHYKGDRSWQGSSIVVADMTASDERVIVATGDGEHAHVMSSRAGVAHATRRPWNGFEEWETSISLTPAATGPGDDLRLQYDVSGDAVAVWVDRASKRVLGQRFRAAAQQWDALPAAVSDLPGPQSSPQVAMDGAGNAAVVWIQDEPGGSQRPMLAQQARDGAWAPAVPLTENVMIQAGAPQVRFGPAGAAVAAWSQIDGGRSNLWSSYRPAGGAWSTPVPIEDDRDWEASPVRLAFDDAGRVLAVWTAAHEVRSVLWSRRFVPGVGWLALTRVAPGHDGVASEPVIAFDEAGKGLVVWEAFDRVRHAVYASRFE